MMPRRDQRGIEDYENTKLAKGRQEQRKICDEELHNININVIKLGRLYGRDMQHAGELQ